MAKAKKKNEEIVEAVVPAEEIDQAYEAELNEMSAGADQAEVVEENDAEEIVAENDDTETEEEVSEVEADDDEEEMEKPEVTQEDIRLVEAILFASSTAVTTAMIAERFPEERVSLIPEILQTLQETYSTRGVNLVQRDKRWVLRTASDLGDQIRLEKEQPKKFTRAAMETLAVIAYHQPVTRAEIENIRGVATSPGALDALLEAEWIKPGKRREVPGRPVTWWTTKIFLDHFGLEKLADLPGMDELKAAGLLDKRPAIEAMPTADLFDTPEEIDEEDPNEITDEDLIGRADSDDPEDGFDESFAEDDVDVAETKAEIDEDGNDEDDDFGNEEASADDFDDMNADEDYDAESDEEE